MTTTMKIRPHVSTAIAVLLAAGAASAHAAEDDWPSYNRTLTSERFSPLKTLPLYRYWTGCP